ncbi:hypothetical protein [Legionella sp. km772]|uniref:hypothetical protein n=1 Tax=Legionella sp. km772 TaxID=2498111 RepID=UPI000F8EF1D1|nr:hypothetical protein [Legionella sp. km772]
MKSTVQILTVLAAQKRMARSLSVSEGIKEILDPISLKQLEFCITQTHEIITLCSSLPGLEKNAAEVMRSRELVNDFIRQNISLMSQINERFLLKLLNSAIGAQHAGNCYEFAFYTQSLLDKAGINTQVFRVKKPGTDDSHVFLVAKLHSDTTNPEDPRFLDSSAMVVDPFMKKIYLAKEIPRYLEVCVFDPKSETVSYLPFSKSEHVLDNKVHKELVEDWQLFLQAKNPPSKEKEVGLDESSSISPSNKQSLS